MIHPYAIAALALFYIISLAGANIQGRMAEGAKWQIKLLKQSEDAYEHSQQLAQEAARASEAHQADIAKRKIYENQLRNQIAKGAVKEPSNCPNPFTWSFVRMWDNASLQADAHPDSGGPDDEGVAGLTNSAVADVYVQAASICYGWRDKLTRLQEAIEPYTGKH